MNFSPTGESGSRPTFSQLVDLDKTRELLEAHFRITGVLSAIVDRDEKILAAVGWQDICVRFPCDNTATCACCGEGETHIKTHLLEFDGGYMDFRCENGLRELSLPIIIDGEHLATFFVGQFFYEDEKPDPEYFRAQARESGFDESEYIDALSRVKVCSRDQIRSIVEYYGCLIRMMAEIGRKNLELSLEVAKRSRAERELKESRDYLYRIMDTVPDPIFVKDREHRLQLVNTAMCQLAGRSREEMVGRTDYDFFPKREMDLYWEKDELLFKTGEEQVNEEEITTAHGDKRVVLTKRARYSHEGGDEYIVGVIRDVTGMKNAEAEVRELNADLERRVQNRTAQLAAAYERLQAETAERKRIFETLQLTQFCVDKASTGIFRISEGGNITFANDLACRSLGYTLEELCSMTLFDIDPTIDLNRFSEHRDLLRTEGSRSFESVHRRKDGSTFPVEITVNYLEYKGRGFTVSFARDITKRKHREEQLRENRLQMDELNRTLCRRVESEVAKNREKDVILIQQNRHAALGETLEHIIHQWKQPLNTIGILVQLLHLEHEKGKLTDNYLRETVAKTMDLLDHMSETAEVFRDFYKPETEKLVFAIKEAVEEAFSFVEPSFRQLNIMVEIDADPDLKAFGYPKEFVQVLMIILTNARDAFRERRTEMPRMAIEAFAEGKKAVITVKDNAGGIAEQVIGKVFDLYFTTKEATGGTGIGLYMARSIIENRMKGSLSVANVDYGARFMIEIGDPRCVNLNP